MVGGACASLVTVRHTQIRGIFHPAAGRFSTAKLLASAAGGVLAAMADAPPALGQTFGQASSAALNSICAGAFPPSQTQVINTTVRNPNTGEIEPPGNAILGFTNEPQGQLIPGSPTVVPPFTQRLTTGGVPSLGLGANLSRVCQARRPPPVTLPSSRFEGFACFALNDDGSGNCLAAGGAVSTTSAASQGGPGTATSGGAAALPFARVAAIQERLQLVRGREEEKPEGRLNSATYAQNEAAGSQSDSRWVPLPPSTPGGTPGAVFALAPGLSAYLAAGATSLTHFNNRYEDGYAAVVPEATAGLDYLITPWMIVGLGFTYSNINARYDDGGDFHTNNYGPTLYATILPFKNAFINAVLGYTWQDNSNERLADPLLGASGAISADYNTNVYSGSILGGYNFPVGRVSVGPRVGASFAHFQTDDFTERGDTGLELSYSGLDQTSVQTSLGAQATTVFETSFGYLVPQISVMWVHEYANDARSVQAQFVEASPSPVFTFKQEKPARNWATISLAMTAILPGGLQPFVQFATMQGNENFATYGGLAGVRFGY